MFFLTGLGGSEKAYHQIERSLRFNDNDSAYLSRTFGTNTSNTIGTLSFWIKRASLGIAAHVWSSTNGASDGGFIGFNTSNEFEVRYSTAGGNFGAKVENRVFRDPSAWYHFIVAYDSTLATAADRIKIFVNGVQQSTLAFTTYPTANQLSQIIYSTRLHNIGRYAITPGSYFDGYMAEFHVVDGQALGPTSFGEFDDNGVWRPINVTGLVYGTNGFHLPFSDNTSTVTLGEDASGNGNDWTLTNFSVVAGVNNDSVEDTPTNNFPTLSAVDSQTNAVLSNGGLGFTINSTAALFVARSTFAIPQSGKWYWEFTNLTANPYLVNYGILDVTTPLTAQNAGSAYLVSYSTFAAYNNGIGGTPVLRPPSYTAWAGMSGPAAANDVAMIAYDADNGTMWFGKNGVWWNTTGTADPATNADPRFSSITGTFAPFVSAYFSTYPDLQLNFGQRPFAYTPPAGFQSLCTANLPTPDIAKPSKHFKALTYTGFTGLIGTETRISPGSKTIARSLRFNDDDVAFLSRTFAQPTNNILWTWSGWVKRGSLTTFGTIFCGGNAADGTNFARIGATDTGGFNFQQLAGDVYNAQLTTTARFRDPSFWYHLSVVYDSANATAADRVRLWVNGARQAVTYTTGPFAANTASIANAAREHRIGNLSYANVLFDGYMAEIHFVDGQALDPTSFGEFDENGIWRPINVTGLTYGTNGFYLPFSDNTNTTTLGEDASGSGNNWTLNNFSVAAGSGNDSLEDTPTNNYCTLNPLDNPTSIIFSEGNLRIASGDAVNFRNTRCSQVIQQRSYWEVTAGNAEFGTAGIYAANAAYPAVGGATGSTLGGATNGAHVNDNGNVVTGGATVVTGGAGFVLNDVAMFAYDPSTGHLWVGRNGTWFNSGNPAAGTGACCTMGAAVRSEMMPASGVYSPAVQHWNFGQRPFAYAPPAGFQSLCTASLPAVANKDLWFDGGVPDLIWIKGRSGANHHKLIDTVRGVTLNLSSSSTGDETGEATVLSLNKFGLKLGDDADVNTQNATYVAWCWDRSITPGFDIVTYTGTGVARTINHGLGTSPKMMIVKARTTAGADQGFAVYHAQNTAQPATDYLLLNSTAATADLDTVWNDTAPTATVFSVGTNALVNTNNDAYIAYLFAEVEGFSKFGTYTGNGSADGPFVWCGFRPRWVLTRRIDSAGNWFVIDTARWVVNSSATPTWLLLESSAAQTTFGTDAVHDILSNGFKIRATLAGLNASGGTFIFAAFAEFPFSAPSPAR